MQENDSLAHQRDKKYYFDFERLETFECGSILLSLLAFPDKKTSCEQLGGMQASLCHAYLSNFYGDTSAQLKPQPMKPLYVFRDTRKVESDMRLLEKRLKQRVAAATMAIPFLEEVELGRLPKLPEGLKRLTLSGMADFMYIMTNQSGPENITRRIWRPSLPVIHIATAIQVTHADLLRISGQPLGYIDLLGNRELLEFIVARSEQHADFLIRSKKLKGESESLIRLSIKS